MQDIDSNKLLLTHKTVAVIKEARKKQTDTQTVGFDL